MTDRTDVFEVPTDRHPYYTPAVDRLAGQQMDGQGGPVRLLPPYQAVWRNPAGRTVHLFAPTSMLDRLRQQGYRLTDSIAPAPERPTAHQARRGSDVEHFIRRHRDTYLDPVEGRTGAWHALDDLLDHYRDHADTGTPLGENVRGPHPDQDGPPRTPTEFLALVGAARAFPHKFAGASVYAWSKGFFPVWIDTSNPDTVADMLADDHLQEHVRDVVAMSDRLIVMDVDEYTDDATQDVINYARLAAVPVTFWSAGGTLGLTPPQAHECGAC